jgi:hypothetical protein
MSEAKQHTCRSCERRLPYSAFAVSANGRPRNICLMCNRVAQARRAHRIAKAPARYIWPRQPSGTKMWTTTAAEELLWELDRPPTRGHPDTREEILAFWGVDEAFVEGWRQRLDTPGAAATPAAAWRTSPAIVSAALDADVAAGLEFLADLGVQLVAMQRTLDRIDKRLQELARLTAQQARLAAAVEALGDRLAALEGLIARQAPSGIDMASMRRALETLDKRGGR